MNKQVSLDSFCRGLEDVLEMNNKLTGEAVSDETKKKLAFWKTGLFRIVIMGECKKGKSSFINALLGVKDLSPVCSDIATSTIYKICYGSEVAYRVFFTVASQKPPLKISKEEVVKYGTENGNPGNSEQVDFIQVTCPSPLLKAGLVIIDTPGLGGLFKQHKLITYQYVPKSDAVFLITESVGAPMGKAEIDLLTDLRKVTKHIYFVQTKAGMVESETADARKENNKKILKESGHDTNELYYFVTDSERKFAADEEHDEAMLEASGYPAVTAFLTQYLQPNVARLIMENALAECRPLINSARLAIANKLRNLETDNEEARGKMVSEIKEMQEKFKEWENDTLPDCKQAFDTRMLEIEQEIAARYEECSPQSNLYKEIECKLQSAPSIDELDSMIEELNVKLPEHFAEVAVTTSRFMREGINSALNSLMESTGMGVNQSEIGTCPVTSVRNTDMIPHVQSAGIKRRQGGQSAFGKTRNAMYGGFAGGTIGTWIGAAIGSVVPVVGTAVGAYVGGMVGGLYGTCAASRDMSQAELQAAKLQVCSGYANWMVVEKNKMLAGYSRLKQEIMLKVNLCIKKATTAFRADMARQLDELKDIGKKSMEERQSDIIATHKLESRLQADMALMGLVA